MYALNKATSLMHKKQRRVMTAEMLLLAFVEMPNIEAHRLLKNFSRQRGFDWAAFAQNVDQIAGKGMASDVRFDFIADGRDRIPLSNDLLTVLDDGLTLANSRNETWCDTLHALAIMATARVGTYRLLNLLGITKRAVIEAMGNPSLSTGATAVDHIELARQEQLAPVYPRDDLLRNLMNLLSMTTARHVILTGPGGVGKHALVLALAKRIAEGKGAIGLKSVVQMNEHALLDNAFTTLQAGLRLANGGVLFVPDIVRFFGGPRRYPEFSDKAANELQKALLGNDVAIIGTATEEQYSRQLSQNSVLIDHSQQFRIPPATVAETVEILNTLGPTFQVDYNLTIPLESLAEVARLAGRYYTVEPMPGAAVHLLHRACAMFRVNLSTEDGLLVEPDDQLDVDDVMKATSILTGIPMTNMGADERERYMHMAHHLHKRIIGQKEPVQALSRAVKMARVGLKDPKRPIGSFMFLGPTGVGKSELAKALAEFMFGMEKALITLDMSEYMEASAVNRLIGSPPGYIGHDAGGQLTDAVKKQPYSVILFDEVEKANVKVFDTLLQVLDEGRLTSGQGETVSFSECIILMTSNIGGRYLSDPELGEVFARDAAEEEVKKHFRPEFLNRLDDIIFFDLLSDENLRDILDLLLGKEEKLLARRQLKLAVTDAAKAWLLAQNDHPEWGARPLRRIIQKHLREPMADFLLQQDPLPGTLVKVQKQGRKLKFVQAKPK
jgi:ATP-dependent Clp protease ATP-binding subunit ClpC